jgi:hypothetical protein
MFDFFIKALYILVFKRHSSANHCKKNDSRGPNIGLVSVIGFSHQHFWSRVAGATSWSEELSCRLEKIRKTKIDKSYSTVAVYQNIFWFQISIYITNKAKPMGNPVLMKVSESINHLNEQ